MARRWPSNTDVSQGRSLSINAAQIFAAAAASLKGPATSRNCMPSPLLRSFTTMIGRSEAIAAAFDLSRARHSPRKPSIEFAPPRSTPNSVRCTAISDGAFDSAGSGAAGAAATTSGTGVAVMTSGGCSGTISFAAAGSGGAIIDLDGISGVAGVAAARLATCRH